MTILTAETSDLSAARRLSLLPLWGAVFVYGLLLTLGHNLLNDPDTMWHVTIGNWIIEHRAVPHVDPFSFSAAGQPWVVMEWLSQVIFATSARLVGWTGPVVLAAAAVATAFALFVSFIQRRLGDIAATVCAGAAFALTAAHLLARPHLLVMPVMVAWVAGLIAAADRREAPSPWLLLLIVLWANLHGSFVFGLLLIGPIALDAVLSAAPSRRVPLLLRWGGFGVLAVLASCLNPYGWNAILEPATTFGLGPALATINEWAPANFSQLGPLEIVLLAGVGLALWRGVTLPPMRILLLMGLVHMALAHVRYVELMALLAPMVIAAPLARQIGSGTRRSDAAPPLPGSAIVVTVAVLIAMTLGFGLLKRYEPNRVNSPVAAVAELKTLGVKRVFNDYDFGGYLIANGVPTFIDGRAEVYGKDFVVEQTAAVRLRPPSKLFRMLDDYNIEATLLRTEDPATKLLDHVDGWQKVYSDDIATIHLRKPGAPHSVEPRIEPAH